MYLFLTAMKYSQLSDSAKLAIDIIIMGKLHLVITIEGKIDTARYKMGSKYGSSTQPEWQIFSHTIFSLQYRLHSIEF